MKPNKEFDKFKDTMRRLMGVPLAEVKELEKTRKKRKAKKPSASRAAAAKS